MPRQRKTQGSDTGSNKPANAKPTRRTAKKAAPRAASKPNAKATTAGRAAAPAKRATANANADSQPAARRANPPGSLEPVTTLRHDEIAERAYLIWMNNGRTPGQEVQHWVEAENQLRQERGAQAQSRR